MTWRTGNVKWVSSDPIGHEGGNNYYAFAETTPISKADVFWLARILACGLAFHPGVRCNNAAAECFAKCACGLGPSTGPRWFCPNGKDAGKFFDDWDKIPADCWEDGKKPEKP